MIRHVLALLLATSVVACTTPREPPPPPMANNSDRCEDLATRVETEEPARERLIAAFLACRLDPAIDAAEAERVLGKRPVAIDVRGDNAIFLTRSSAPEVTMTGTLTALMERIAKTDLWVARFRFHLIDYALLKFLPMAGGKQLPGTKPVAWRGPNAPDHPAEKRDLTGKIVKRTLWSDALQETRKIDVYLPPSYSPDGSYPTLYMGDGEFLEGWARYIEPMIGKGAIPAIVIVGAWSGQAGIVENRSSLGVELRAADYLPGFKNAGDRFDRHMRFFTQELVPYAEKEFALVRDRSKRALQGQSNSAVFAREAALMHGELFSTALAFSGGWKLSERFGPSDAPRARFIMGAGLYEGGFSVGTQVAARTLREKGFNVLEEYLFAGHDPDAWAFLLVKYLPRAFPIVSDTVQSTPALPRYDRVLLLEQTSETSANVSIGDLNKDGNLDIVLAKGRHWPLIDRVLLGDGRGGIASAYNLGVASDRSYSGRLADLDGDGDLDVVLSNDAPDPKRIYLNNGTGRFREGSDRKSVV